MTVLNFILLFSLQYVKFNLFSLIKFMFFLNLEEETRSTISKGSPRPIAKSPRSPRRVQFADEPQENDGTKDAEVNSTDTTVIHEDKNSLEVYLLGLTIRQIIGRIPNRILSKNPSKKADYSADSWICCGLWFFGMRILAITFLLYGLNSK